MDGKKFVPENFIDREAEQELFEELLKLKDEARLLTIRDEGGKGKSALLMRLHYNCLWRSDPPKLVSLVPLDQLSDPSPFTLISTIREELELDFRRFDLLSNARRRHDFSPFDTSSSPTYGVVSASSATISGPAVVGGVVYQFQNPQTVSVNAPGDWGNPEQEQIARQKCIEAFFEDLKQICDERPVVVLLDTWERCNPVLQEWILNKLLRLHCFDMKNRPAQFILILAGRKLPDFKMRLEEVRYQKLVRSIESLGAWEENHVKAFLKVHGHEDINDEDINYLCAKLKGGWSLEKALRMVREYVRAG